MRNSLLLLGELTDEDVDWFRHTGGKVNLVAGSVLIEEGKSVQALYVLLDGTLVVKASTPGRPEESPRIVARLITGEVIGEMSFVDHRPPSATVIAETDSILLAIPQTQLLERAETDLAFGKRFYRGLAFCLSNRLRLMNVSLPQAGIEVTGEIPPEMRNPDVAAHEAAARARLDSLIATAR